MHKAKLCEHCGNPISKHPMRWETTRGVITCSAEAPAASKVIDLMQALKDSLKSTTEA